MPFSTMYVMTKNEFSELLFSFYDQYKRSLPWRSPERDGSFDPYKIFISEMMLQQTQVDRVIPKFEQFIARFPDVESLAKASLAEVLSEWSGLGYNRRAQYVQEAAKILSEKHVAFPKDIASLTTLKGVGVNTAAAILVYSFNQKEYFVETNIRTVYIHHFFAGKEIVTDAQILDKVAETMPEATPREFYWALMDYGSFLKKQGIRNISQSKHYKKQSRFEGSSRQIRGKILRRANAGITESGLRLEIDDKRLDSILDKMQQERLILVQNGRVSVA